MANGNAPEQIRGMVYAALGSGNAAFAAERGLARRFQRDTIPFGAIAEPSLTACSDLLHLLDPGEEIYLTVDPGEEVLAHEGLEQTAVIAGLQMRFNGAPPQESADDVVRLTADDTEDMLALKARAFPGYFGSRAPELGRFFGIREAASGKLIAMGGERFQTGTHHEISALCTDPSHLGHSHATRILNRLLAHQASLGVESLLHVTEANTRAIAVYERLGFCVSGPIQLVGLRRRK